MRICVGLWAPMRGTDTYDGTTPDSWRHSLLTSGMLCAGALLISGAPTACPFRPSTSLKWICNARTATYTMRVLLVSYHLYPDDRTAEGICVAKTARALRDAGHEVTVITS